MRTRHHHRAAGKRLRFARTRSTLAHAAPQLMQPVFQTQPEPQVDEILQMDLLTLSAPTEQAGNRLDPATQRAAIAASLAVSDRVAVRRQGRLVGYALLRPQPDGSGFVGAFNTHPAHRDAAVMRCLIGQLLTRAACRGFSALRSHVYKSNRLSMAFHIRLGFQITRQNDKAVEFSASLPDLQARHPRLHRLTR